MIGKKIVFRVDQTYIEFGKGKLPVIKRGPEQTATVMAEYLKEASTRLIVVLDSGEFLHILPDWIVRIES